MESLPALNAATFRFQVLHVGPSSCLLHSTSWQKLLPPNDAKNLEPIRLPELNVGEMAINQDLISD